GDGLADLVVVNSGVNDPGPTVTILLNQSGSQTQVSSSANPVDSGQPLTLQATVQGLVLTTPATGSVTFTDSQTPLGTASVGVVPAGLAQLVLPTGLPGGSHTITAVYSGDSSYSPSSASFAQVVRSGTSTSLTSSVNPIGVGQQATLTATVTALDAGA